MPTTPLARVLVITTVWLLAPSLSKQNEPINMLIENKGCMATFFVNEPIALKNSSNSSTTKFEIQQSWGKDADLSGKCVNFLFRS